MQTTPAHDSKIASLRFTAVYPCYLAKVISKGRTELELQQVICWLTGFDVAEQRALIKDEATLAEFFERATLNPNANQITGTICGYRIEEIANKTTRQVRYMDKLVDELAKGKQMEDILR